MVTKATAVEPPVPGGILGFAPEHGGPPAAAAQQPVAPAPGAPPGSGPSGTGGGGGEMSFNSGGSMSGGGAAGDAPRGGIEQLPTSQKKFAWGAERIAHELVCKFDQFTRRREDHMRKLLWTFGTDPYFESANKNAILVSPQNFNRVCDRFGLLCTEEEASKIFKNHGLPQDGCNMYTLAKNFLDTPDDTIVRKKAGGPTKARPPPGPRVDPFKLARLPDSAWKEYASRSRG